MHLSGVLLAALGFAIAYRAVVGELRRDLDERGRVSISSWVLYAAVPGPVILLVLEDVARLGGPVALWSSLGVALSVLGAVLAVSTRRALDAWRRGVTDAPLGGGPYSVMRHPQAVGFGAALLGLATASMSGGAVLVALLHWPVLLLAAHREERRLRERFGEGYDRYAAEVGLWGARRFSARRPTRRSPR